MPEESGKNRGAVWPFVKALLAVAAVEVLVGRAASDAPPADRMTTTDAPRSAEARPTAGAASPADVPARGWMEIAKSVWARIGKNRVIAVAAGFTFYAILAIFPAITAIVSVYGLFSDTGSIERHLTDLNGLLPGGAIDVISEQVKRIAAQGSGKLGFAFLIGLGTAIWSANAGMKAMFDALNVAYEQTETRGFIHLNALSLGFTAGALVFVTLALGSIIVAPLLLDAFGIGSPIAADMLAVGRWIALMALIVLGLACLYRFGAARTEPAWKWVTPGSLFASVAWVIASVGFSFYAQKFGSYNQTYGTLGAAIGFMTWIWISAIVIMVGAELNVETEQQAAGAAPTKETGRANSART